MPIKSTPCIGVWTLGLMLGSPLWAQDQPLSVIDWVQQNPGQPAITSVAMPNGEPPVTPSGLVPPVDVQPLQEEATRIIGLVPSSVTGLPQSLWRDSRAEDLNKQLKTLPEFRLPAAQALLFTALLTDAQGPGHSVAQGGMFTLERIATLQRFGALDPALVLIDQAGVTRDEAHFAAYMDLALLTGDDWQACNILTAHPHLSPSAGHRIFCAARKGDWATAALFFDTSRALALITPDEIELLDRFLHPEYFDGLPPIRPPAEITPLLFRLHDTIGEPLPTRFLPRPYAVADLGDIAGWKAQLEAAERLAKSGALPDNRLLGLYTERLPAASGGIWDRVKAIQHLDTALDTGSAEAVAKTLPEAWIAMQAAGLETAFADLFRDRLKKVHLTGEAAQIAETLAFLSSDYRIAAQHSDDALLRAVADGDPAGLQSDDRISKAVIEGFNPKSARADLLAMAQEGKLGEVILRTLVLLEEGGAGDTVTLTQALGTLRALGFDDTVRRASLQILLLDRFGK